MYIDRSNSLKHRADRQHPARARNRMPTCWFQRLLFALLLMLPLAVAAAPIEYCEVDESGGGDRPNDSAALEGVEVGRIFWDVTMADPVALSGRLAVIDETYRDMVRQNVRPEMVLAFRGGAIRFLAADLDSLPEDIRPAARDVQRRLREMMELPGVRIEACYIAMRRVPLEPENLLSGVFAVGNTFLSAMGYGQKGYVSIPIY